MATWAKPKCLKKSELGGVIFGCTNNTMDECLTNQLFGLPGQHILYVKNIEPGLPLFLFNYSERKLHGIYEASCSGKMNIDSHAWTGGGSEKTKFPAQVRVCVRLQCQPLVEDQFKPIISENYYSQNHFRFELDHAQVNKLISVLSSPVRPRVLTLTPNKSKKTKKWRNMTMTSTPDEKGDESGASEPLHLTTDDSECLYGDNNQLKEESSEQNHEMPPCDENDLLYMRLKELSLSDEFSGANMADVAEASSNDNADVECEKLDSAMTNSHNWEDESAFSSLDCPTIISQLRGEIEELKAFKQQQALNMEKMETKLFDAEQKINILEKRCTILEPVSNPHVTLSGNETLIGSNGIQSDLNESIFIVGGYDGVSWSAALDSFSPSCDILTSRKPMPAARAHTSVAKLGGELYVIGGGTDSTWCATVESYNTVDDQWTTHPLLNAKKGCLASAALNGKLFSMGGGNGVQSTSDVEMLDPNAGRWISECSMLEKRFALAAVECHGALYAIGGFDGNEYLKSGERFDPREQRGWTRIRSMNTKRGGHSVVSLNEKLYAIGGHDGDKMVPIVEIYEPRVGTWMEAEGEPMNRGRFFLAAALVKDTIYAIGGLTTGSVMVDTIECYKEGEGWKETELRSVGKRCYASAIVLGED